jgi:regulatory protein
MHSGSGKDAESADERRAACRKKAERLLARRGHAASELRGKLRRKGFEAGIVDTIIEQLREAGALDDRRFAVHQAELLRDKGWGPRQIRNKLGDKGVGRDVIDETLAAVGGDEVWLRRCWERARSKFGGDPGAWPDKKMKRAFRHLRHRGFRDATIRRICFDGVVPDDVDVSDSPSTEDGRPT